MGVFEFVLAIVLISAVVKIVQTRSQQKERWQNNQTQNAELVQRLDKLERRMANLETIVLEAEKKREYERL